MDIEVSHYDSSKKFVGKASSGNSFSPTTSQKKIKKEKKAEKKLDKKSKQQRKISESSSAVSETSATNQKLKPVLRKQSASTSRDETKRKVLVGQERNNALSDNWHRIVDEYEGTYLDSTNKSNTHESMDGRNVGKLSNFERFDKVNEVFGVRGVQIPIHAVSSKTLRDIETESATSVESEHSQSRGSKQHFAPRKSRIDMVRNSKLHKVSKRSSTESSRRSSFDIPRRSSSEVAYRHAGQELARTTPNSNLLHPDSAYSQRSMGGQNMHQSNMASTKMIHAKQVVHSTNIHPRPATPNVHTIQQKKKTMKKSKSINKNAADIVEQVIDKALDFLYKSPRSKRKHSSSNTAQNNTRVSQRAVVYDSRDVHSVEDHRTNLASSNNQVRTNQRKSLASSAMNEVTDRDINHSELMQERSYNYRQSAMAYKPRRVSLSPKPQEINSYDLALGQYRAQSSFDGMHSPRGAHSDISQAYTSSDTYNPSSLSPKPKLKQKSTFKSSSNHNTPTGTLQLDKARSSYSSDSEYSTTLEIKSPKLADTATKDYDTGSLKKVKKVLPPTLTKGTVTRFLHEVKDKTEATETGPNSEMYSTNTWPSTRNTHYPETFMPERGQSNVTLYATLPNGRMSNGDNLLKFSNNYCTLPATGNGTKSTFHKEVQLLVDTSLHKEGGRDDVQALDLPTIQEVDENQYAAFSNEPIYVGDLVDGKESIRKHWNGPRISGAQFISASNRSGNIYGTKPAVCMNNRQTLNFFVFNQMKPDINQTYIQEQTQIRKDDADYGDGADAVEERDEYDTEYKKYLIYHKQTQTPSLEVTPTPPLRKARKIKRIPRSPSPKIKHRETTHYVTKETQIEKLPEKPCVSEMWCQTDASEPSSPREWSESYEVNTYCPPVVVETEVSTHKELPGRSIPITLQEKTNFLDVINQEINRPKKEVVPVSDSLKEEESEEEVIETVEIEEKEQRIGMAIFEELEFRTERTQGGKTSLLDSDIPAFWLPDRFEATVDRRKQKKIQVKEVTKSGEDTLWCNKRKPLALSNNTDEVGSKLLELMPAGDYIPKVLEDISVSSSKTKKVSDEEQGQDVSLSQNERYSTPNMEPPDYSSVKNHTFLANGLITNDLFKPNAEVKNVNHSSSKTCSSPYRNTTSHEYKVAKPANLQKFGSLHKPNITFPDVPPRNMYQEDSDALPESLDHFEQIVSSMERELPPVPNKAPPPPPPPKMHSSWSAEKLKTSPHSTLQQQISSSSHHSFGSGVQPFRGGKEFFGSRQNSLERHPSRSDPFNVSFGKKSGTDLMREANGLKLQSSTGNASRHSRSSDLQNEVVYSSQSEPVLESKIVRDKDGNLVKVTELKHTLTKTREFDEVKDKCNSEKNSVNMEQLGDSSYIDVDLFDSKAVDEENDNEVAELYEKSLKKKITNHGYTGPEVVEETTVGLKPLELEAQEKTVKIADDGSGPKEQKFLYNIKTAKLTPKDVKGVRVLDKYESMSTEL